MRRGSRAPYLPRGEGATVVFTKQARATVRSRPMRHVFRGCLKAGSDVLVLLHGQPRWLP